MQSFLPEQRKRKGTGNWPWNHDSPSLHGDVTSGIGAVLSCESVGFCVRVRKSEHAHGRPRESVLQPENLFVLTAEYKCDSLKTVLSVK